MGFISGIIFLIIIFIFLRFIIKGILTWVKNNNSPRLTVNAKVVSKRINVINDNNANINNLNNGYNSVSVTSHTNYYTTFQVDTGERMEFQVKGKEYGMLTEGDLGKLTYQGTRYISFIRNR